MGVDLSKWGWTKWIGMPVDQRRRPFGLVFSLRNFKNICRQVGVSLCMFWRLFGNMEFAGKRTIESLPDYSGKPGKIQLPI